MLSIYNNLRKGLYLKDVTNVTKLKLLSLTLGKSYKRVKQYK